LVFTVLHLDILFLFSFLQYWTWNLGHCIYYALTLLESHLQFLDIFFFKYSQLVLHLCWNSIHLKWPRSLSHSQMAASWSWLLNGSSLWAVYNVSVILHEIALCDRILIVLGLNSMWQEVAAARWLKSFCCWCFYNSLLGYIHYTRENS
jgi:hypothetical protein